MIGRFLQWINRLMSQALALWFCARHPETPFIAKMLAIGVAAYAFSPIDLIPDFIPVLGFLDDALLLPLGIWLALKLIPKPVLDDCRAQAAQWMTEKRSKPRNWFGAAIVILIWLAAAWLTWHFYRQWFVT
jgi:uncharacterized membrane protein YkvA (DUF1232 family)